jgi:hypothetical protein
VFFFTITTQYFTKVEENIQDLLVINSTIDIRWGSDKKQFYCINKTLFSWLLDLSTSIKNRDPFHGIIKQSLIQKYRPLIRWNLSKLNPEKQESCIKQICLNWTLNNPESCIKQTCLNWTLNKPESCIKQTCLNWTLNKPESCINWTLDKVLM